MKLYIIRGIPGSGKSSLAKTLLESGVVNEHFEADMWRYTKDGVYQWDLIPTKEAHENCRIATAQALHEGHNVAVANTFVKMWEIKPYLKLAEDFGAEVVLITAEGRHPNIHNVPEDVVKRMEAQFERISDD